MSQAGGSWARGNYGANSGPCFYSWVGSQSESCLSGVLGAGVMTINWGAVLGRLSTQDGSSNTIMFGELRTGLAPQDVRGTWALGWPGASTLAGASIGDDLVPNTTHVNADDVEGCTQSQNMVGGAARLAQMGMGCYNSANYQATARSQHPGGVMVALCDGSTRFISETIARRAWYCALSRMDGQPAQLP
jgi:hypothetical protein